MLPVQPQYNFQCGCSRWKSNFGDIWIKQASSSWGCSWDTYLLLCCSILYNNKLFFWLSVTALQNLKCSPKVQGRRFKSLWMQPKRDLTLGHSHPRLMLYCYITGYSPGSLILLNLAWDSCAPGNPLPGELCWVASSFWISFLKVGAQLTASCSWNGDVCSIPSPSAHLWVWEAVVLLNTRFHVYNISTTPPRDFCCVLLLTLPHS